MAFDRVTIDNCTLYLGDCLEVLPTLGQIDAIVSDPPYGMRWNPDTTRFSGGYNPQHRNPGRNDNDAIVGDDKSFDPTLWLRFPQVILWGANHYAEKLPRGTTLVWVKRNDAAFASFLSDGELAWMKGNHGVYCFRDLSMNMSVSERQHPNQKPLPLMRWCVNKTQGMVLDPYMGSGTTGLACMQLARPFTGIEIDPKYFTVACQRLEDAARQPLLLSGAG